MKKKMNEKKAVFLLLMLSMALGVKAQISHSQKTWPMPGAEWTYCLLTEGGDAYAKEIWRVTGDSLIRNHNYDIIQPVDTFGHPITNSRKMLLTRFENDTVYRFVNDMEYLFFAFNIDEGDVFTTFRSAGWGENSVPNYGNDSACCSLKPLLVTQKKEVELGGLAMNEYVMKDTLFTDLYGYEDLGYWKMVDRIGPIDTYPLIDINEIGFFNGFCIYSFVCASHVYLSAYRDDSFEYVWFVCNPSSVDENSMEKGLEAYPNPSTGIVHIESDQIAEVKVYNSFGILVKTIQNTNVINLETLPQGMYLLVMYDTKNTRYTTKVILK